MFIVLSNRDPKPMYQQVIDQIKEAIARGECQPDEKLPSVRELARALNISVITIKRAYMELEKSGQIYTRPGMGSFVADISPQRLRREKLEEYQALLRGMLETGKRFGISKQDIIALIEGD